MMHQLIQFQEGEGLGSGPRQSKTNMGYEYPHQEYHYTTTGNPNPKWPKLEFPRFCGEDSYGWVRKAEKYFDFNPVDEQYKVGFASVHFFGQAEFWYGTYSKARGKVSWPNFVRNLHARFSSLFRESIIGEFHKLRQTTTVEHFYNDFETLRSILVSEGINLEEDYFIQSFISGLKDEIRLEVEKFDVGDLSRAIFLARKQEDSLNNAWHHPRTTARTQPTLINTSPAKLSPNSTSWRVGLYRPTHMFPIIKIHLLHHKRPYYLHQTKHPPKGTIGDSSMTEEKGGFVTGAMSSAGRQAEQVKCTQESLQEMGARDLLG
ncbi:hypothetical protein RJ640_026800 [Escallonia rubra]|uniref:Ty3 transposon capsid-like protein domain-containing protein n=1 Tax=Escallonia rubra TaxID=112253 RepID=A0AA88QSN1_9ASTE|nr:hypothetical protein RJ640_026800 [Escallonia rubra]